MPTSILTLRGMKDFAPKPWPVRFREIQEAGGKIDVKTAAHRASRLARDRQRRARSRPRMAASTAKSASRSRASRNCCSRSASISWRVRAPAATSSIPRSMRSTRSRRASAIFARDRAAPALAAGAAMLGQATELEGRKAVALPLRFDDGKVYLGPFKIGRDAGAILIEQILSGNRSTFGIIASSRTHRLRHRRIRQARMRAAEIGRGRILSDLHDAAPDRARAGEMLEQGVAVAAPDRARELSTNPH